MLWYTIINIIVGIVAVFAVLGIYHKDKKLQEEFIKQQSDTGICDNCKNLKIKCACGDKYEGHRYKCKFYSFDLQPSACGDYEPKDCNH